MIKNTYPLSVAVLAFLVAIIVSNNAAADILGVVMSEHPKYHSQSWSQTSRFLPSDSISKHWNDNKFITALTYSNNNWFVAFSKGTGYTKQSYSCRKYFPHDWVKQKMKDKYFITSVAYGATGWVSGKPRLLSAQANPINYRNNWCVVMSKTNEFLHQKIDVYNGDYFNCSNDANYEITNIAISLDTFLLVRSKKKIKRKQVVAKRGYFPSDFIDDHYQKGYRVTVLMWHFDKWYVAMTKNTNIRRQIFGRTPSLSKFIDREWGKKKNISIGY